MAPVFGEGGNLPTRFFEYWMRRPTRRRAHRMSTGPRVDGVEAAAVARASRENNGVPRAGSTARCSSARASTSKNSPRRYAIPGAASSSTHASIPAQAMQDTVTSRELFERMPTRPALAEPEVAAHKVRSYEDDSTDWAPSGGRAAAPEQPAQPARRRPVRSTRNRDPVFLPVWKSTSASDYTRSRRQHRRYTGQKTIGGAPSKRSAPLVRVGTELRFELIAKPALASHVHGADPRRYSTPSTRANYSLRFSQVNGPSASWVATRRPTSSACDVRGVGALTPSTPRPR